MLYCQKDLALSAVRHVARNRKALLGAKLVIIQLQILFDILVMVHDRRSARLLALYSCESTFAREETECDPQ